MNHLWVKTILLSVVALLLVGCASTGPKSTSTDTEGYQQDKHLQKVWLADHFDFTGYDALHIAETKTMLTKTNSAKAAELLDWAKTDLQNEFVQEIGRKKIFNFVTANENELSGRKLLKLENTIIEYAKGSGAARFWAGEFGAGQPVIRVRGQMSDGTNTVFKFEGYRSGDSASARLDPGWTPEKSLQALDIHDLAVDLANFINQTSKHQPRK